MPVCYNSYGNDSNKNRMKEGSAEMLKRIREALSRELIRPLIYKIFTRGILALFAARLVHFFLPHSWPITIFTNQSLLLAAIFLIFAVLAGLRLDGMRIPQLRLPRIKRKDPSFLTGDLADHLDEDLVTFDELDEEEQNVCVLLADLILSLICFLLTWII